MDNFYLRIEEIEFCENNDIESWQIFDADTLKKVSGVKKLNLMKIIV